MRRPLLIALLAPLLLAACGGDGGSDLVGEPVYADPSNEEGLRAIPDLGMVAIMEGRDARAICRTAAREVEQVRFVDGQQRLVVKSRNEDGPATIQLFDTATGAEIDRLSATEVRDNPPPWAAGLAD